MCWPDFCATNSLWFGKYRPASVRFTVYSRQTEAGVARALISRLKAAEFVALRGGVDQYQGHCERVPLACPLTGNAQGSQARLGPRLMPPQSQLLAYGPASPVSKSVELVLRSRTSPTRNAPSREMRSAPEPATRFDGMPSDARLR